MKLNLNRLRFDIIDALKHVSVGHYVDEGSGYWIYPLGVVIELDPTLYSQNEITEVENYLQKELQKNLQYIRLEFVPEHPLEGQVALILGTQLPKNRPFNVRRQTFEEVFTNELRREGYLIQDRLVRRVRVKFFKAACEKISGHSVDGSFFQTALHNYSQDHTRYKIEEVNTPLDRGYILSELDEAFVTFPGVAGSFDVTPLGIHNSTHAVVHLNIQSLCFSSIKGVALLPGQTLSVFQKLDVEAIQQQIDLSKRRINDDLVCDAALPESEFDLLPRQNIVFKPLSLPFRPKPRTRLFPSGQEKYQLLYVGARMRSLRTEIYISDLFDPSFNSPIAITAGHTQADRARWYAFNQLSEIQFSEPVTSFRILPGYLFRAGYDQFRIRNIHLAFQSPHSNEHTNALSYCEILMEPSDSGTLILVQKPKPVVVAAFSEHDMQDIRLGRDRFQLRIERSHRRISPLEREAVLKIREGPALAHKPWKSIPFEEPFIVGNHILRVSTN